MDGEGRGRSRPASRRRAAAGSPADRAGRGSRSRPAQRARRSRSSSSPPAARGQREHGPRAQRRQPRRQRERAAAQRHGGSGAEDVAAGREASGSPRSAAWACAMPASAGSGEQAPHAEAPPPLPRSRGCCAMPAAPSRQSIGAPARYVHGGRPEANLQRAQARTSPRAAADGELENGSSAATSAGAGFSSV